MKRSTERFLTTHAGSLPRPEDLVRMMYAKEEGVPVDSAALASRIRSAVEDIVHKQAGAGVDVMNDGEMSKPSYATYVKDRLAGFGGTGNTFVYQDLAEFPNLAKRVFGDPGRVQGAFAVFLRAAPQGQVHRAGSAGPASDCGHRHNLISEIRA